jgi:hypothetical protein
MKVYLNPLKTLKLVIKTHVKYWRQRKDNCLSENDNNIPVVFNIHPKCMLNDSYTKPRYRASIVRN